MSPTIAQATTAEAARAAAATVVGRPRAPRIHGCAEMLGIDAFLHTGFAFGALALAACRPGARRHGETTHPLDAIGRGRGPPGPHRTELNYSGMFPCLRFGPGSRLVSSVCSAVMTFVRVSCGTITSSM